MSLLNTRVQNMRAKSNADAFNLRFSSYGATSAFLASTRSPVSIITSDMEEKAWRSAGFPAFQVPVFDVDSVSITNTRSVTIADSENTSQMLAVTFVTYAFGFSVTPSMHNNNEKSVQEDFERKLNKYLQKFYATVETDAVTTLDTVKSQKFGDTLGFANSGNTLIADLADQYRALGQTDSVNFANDSTGPFHVVGNPGFQFLTNELKEKMTYNESDKSWQFGNKNLYFTNGVANGSGNGATFFTIQDGTIGLLFRPEVEALYNTVSRTGHEWSVGTLPGLEIPCGQYYYEGVLDRSALAGAASAHMERAWSQYYGWSIDIAFVTMYNQDLATYANGIVKFAVATT